LPFGLLPSLTDAHKEIMEKKKVIDALTIGITSHRITDADRIEAEKLYSRIYCTCALSVSIMCAILTINKAFSMTLNS